MSVTTPHFRMVDRMLDGKLEALLREQRGTGMSWEEIARRLYADHDIPISGATIRKWGNQLGIADPTDIDSPDDDEPVAATG